MARMLALGRTGLLFSQGDIDAMGCSTRYREGYKTEEGSLCKCQLESAILTLQNEIIATVVLSSLRAFLMKLT
jgi:hypothetical protein